MSSFQKITGHCRVYSLLKHPPPSEIYTLSLHDALPIWRPSTDSAGMRPSASTSVRSKARTRGASILAWMLNPKSSLRADRSEEHTSELQSRLHLVCRLLLEKKKTKRT